MKRLFLILPVLLLLCVSAHAQNFYVSTTGNDANNGTSIGTAWRTIQHSMNAATAGSTVNIVAGTYHERLTMGVSGTSGNVITFQPNNFSVPSGGCGGYTGVTCGGDTVILDYSTFGTITDGVPLIDINGKSFVTIQGLTLQNFTTQETSFVVNYAIRTHGSASAVTLQYLKLLTFTELGTVGSAFQHGVWCDSPATMTFQNSEMGAIHNHDAAVQWTCSGVVVTNNYLHDVDQIGISPWNNATNYTVSHNKLDHVSVQSGGTCFYSICSVALYNDGGNNGVFDSNWCNFCGVGIEALSEPGLSATHDIKIRNNIIENSVQSGLVIGTWYSAQGAASVFNINIWNNTLYNNNPNVAIPSIGVQPFTAASVTWENNIFFGSSNYSNAGAWATGTTGYNVYAGGGGTGPGSNNVTSNPLFAYAAGNVFTLSSGSPALNAGDPATTTANAGITDFYGNPRFLGTAIDIGASEGVQNYFAQNAAGAGNGADCADARALSSHVIGDDVPGVILHLCGTITGALNATGFTFLASGTVGNPITFLFEPGAVMTSAAWGAAFTMSNKSNIVIDGGTNGIIQNTANGSLLANQLGTGGVSITCGNNIEIKNLSFINMYVHVPSGEDGGSSGAISVNACGSAQSGLHFHNLTMHDGHSGIFVQYGPGFSNAEFDHNTIYNIVWGIALLDNNNGSTATGVLVHDNDIHDFANWFDGAFNFHFDGIFFSAFAPSTTFTNSSIWNNHVWGSTNVNGTGYIFLSGSGGGMSGINVFNNLLGGTVSIVSPPTPAGSPEAHIVMGFGPHNINFLNNTMVGIAGGAPQNCIRIRDSGASGIVLQNNICSQAVSAVDLYAGNTVSVANFNVYDVPSVFKPLQYFVHPDGTFQATFAAWIAATGLDTPNSVSGNPNLSTSYLLQSGSAAINAGKNLTSLGIGALNFGAPQTFGATGSCGTGCVQRAATGTIWDAGAYPFVSSAPPIIGMSPSPAAFSNQNVSTTSGPLTVTVSNTGTGTQVLSTPYFTITGTNASNFVNVGTGTCANGGSIAPSSSCTVNLTFTPSASGARSATLTIQGTVFATDSLTGTGIAPVISIAPSPVAFSNQNVNSTSSPLTVTISNTGTASEILATPYFTITGTNAGDFTNAGTGSCANGGTIAASASCTVNLTFTPSAIGSRTANLNILGTVNALASITGTGLQKFASLSRTSIAFASQTTGTTSGNQAVTLTNTGNTTLTITSISLTGPNAADFGTNGNTCGGTLAASTSCSLNVTFAPSTVGSKTASLVFVTNAPTSPDSVALTGTGVAPAVPIVSFSPSPAAFGNQRTGTSSAPLTVTVSNTGTSTETLSTPYFTITGPNAASFANLGTGTCANAGTIAASSSCTVNLAFTPAVTGAMSATLTINGTVSATNSLTGTGVTPIIGLSPSPAAFGNQNVGSPSSPVTVTVSNTGTSTETLSTPFLTITGTNAADFARSGGTCSNAGTIAASGSCTVILTFTPGGTGSRSALLTIQGTLNATDSLTGTGIASAVTLAPTTIAFGNQTSGTTSGNTAVTLTNSGTATLNITSIALTGANAGEFSTNGSTCGSTLAVSASCGLNVAFSPVSVGAKTASLTFTTDAASSPNNIPLTGTGTAVLVPSLSFSPSPVAFGNQTQGTTSGATTLTVSNTGTAAEVLATPFFTITGANASSFANSGAGTCVNGGTIAVSGSCTVTLTFTPSTTGALAGTLNILGTVNGSNSMTGTGTPTAPPGVGLSPTSINYGNQDDGTSSPPTQVFLTNSGTGTLTVTSIALTGANASEFSINTNTCGASLAPSASCSWNVVFSPVTAGSKSASVTVTTNAATSPDAVPLTGTGRVPTPPNTPAPAITIVTILPAGSVVVSASGSGVSPRNAIATQVGCSQDNVNFQNPCPFVISCGNCSKNTTVRWNGTQVSQTFKGGNITVYVPASMISAPLVPTDYQISLSN